MTIQDRFADTLLSLYGLTAEESALVYARYRRDEIIKIDGVNGSWSLVNGMFLDEDVIREALSQEMA